ncbi:MAG: hypothetical protein PF440_02815 [Thiomicrorhabdus sp.]|nr:hypothetical protein [Thiomicrorhabdus sp.]
MKLLSFNSINSLSRIALLGLFCLMPLQAVAQDGCQRIISQSPYITHQLDYLGLKECIVGASRYDKALNVANTGGLFDPDKQIIESLNADLWITSNWTKQALFDEITPLVGKALRLDSFESMSQIESNLSLILQTLGRTDLQVKVDDFARNWRSQAKAINAQGQRVLLISSCSGQPYAFGQKSYLTDLFTLAGFKVAGENPRITHLPITQNANALEQLIAKTQPDTVFIFEQTLSNACRLLSLPKHTTIVTLDGHDFLQPAPTLLLGLEKLHKNPMWRLKGPTP